MKYFRFLLLCMGCISYSLHAQTITRVEYYVDTDPGYGLATTVAITEAVTINDLAFQVPMTNLTDGLHKLHIRARDNNGRWSQIESHPFLRVTLVSQVQPVVPKITQIEYFLDTDPGFGLATQVTISSAETINSFTIPVSMTNVAEGLHTFYVRAKDENGRWATVSNHPFLRISGAVPAAIPVPNLAQVEYFIDTDPGFGLATSIPITSTTNATLNTTVSLSGLALGQHYMHIRAKDINGRWSQVNSYTFIVSNQALAFGSVPPTWCLAQTFSIPVQVYGNFNTGNVFHADLYTEAGQLIGRLGSLTSTTTGNITATIPTVTALGSYKIRLISTSPTLDAYPEIPLVVSANCPPPCPQDVVLPINGNDFVSGTTSIKSNATTGSITASNKILNNATVATYEAGRFILLAPGFEAGRGTIFIAQKGGCQ